MASSVFLDLTNQGGPFSGQQIGPAADNTAAPPFTFLNDLNTGLGSSAADTLDLITGGTSRLTVTSTAVTSTVPIGGPIGSATAVGLYLGGDVDTGFWYDNPVWAYTQGGSNRIRFGGADTTLSNDQTLGWASGDAVTTVQDTSVGRLSAGRITASALGRLGGITSLGVTGVPVVVAVGRVTAASAADAAISTFTVGAADASFEVSANMNVTASTVLTTTLTCTYTDESNTARSMILPVSALAGSFIAAGAITGAGATVWSTPVMHIRCKAATAITILTSAGTFTGVTYTAEGVIKQTK